MPTQYFQFTVKDIVVVTERHPDVVRRDIRSGSLTPTSLLDLSRYVLGHVMVRDLDIALPDSPGPGPVAPTQPTPPKTDSYTAPPTQPPTPTAPVQRNPTIMRSGIAE